MSMHGKSILARTALGWTSLEERRALMKAKLMYKTVNQLAPQRLCNIFQFSNTVNSYTQEVLQLGFLFQGPGQTASQLYCIVLYFNFTSLA